MVNPQVLVLEYLKGGQLLDHLHTIGEHYTERQAAALFAQARTPLWEARAACPAP